MHSLRTRDNPRSVNKVRKLTHAVSHDVAVMAELASWYGRIRTRASAQFRLRLFLSV